MTNPYNNRLTFSAEGKRLGLAASHEFTSLDPASPLTFGLSLGKADTLARRKSPRGVPSNDSCQSTMEPDAVTVCRHDW